MQLYKKYLVQSEFTSMDDFMTNYKIKETENFNFAYDIVDEYARLEPNKVAIIWTNDEGKHVDVTYAELKRKSDEAASYLQQIGIGHGDKVMLILMRRLEFWYAIIALHKLGAVAIPATHLLTKKDIVYRCSAASIKAIIAANAEQVVHHVDEARNDCETLEHCIVTVSDTLENWDSWENGIAKAPLFVRPEKASAIEDTSLLYFTSGTTGDPKMVAHNFAYPLGHIITASFWHNVKEDGVHLTVADTGWGKAVWGKLYGQMMAGCSVFIYDHKKFTPSELLAVISKYKVTSFCAPPTIYRFLIKEDIAAYDLSSLEYCTTAGEALSPKVFDTFKDLTGIMLVEAFGQTETTVQIGTYPWMTPKPGSMGMPSPLYKVELHKPDGTFCEVGEQGEIVIDIKNGKPIGLFTEYYRDPEKTSEVLYGGFYHTGDIAWRDEDGYYWFVGRGDDVIKSSGYRIGPFEVESALMTHPAVVECAITGVPDDVRGQVVKATIVLSKEYAPGSEALVKEIQNYMKKVTAPYKYPRIIEFVEALPKTISGKIRRVELRNKKA